MSLPCCFSFANCEFRSLLLQLNLLVTTFATVYLLFFFVDRVLSLTVVLG
jgi:hypothetical protein